MMRHILICSLLLIFSACSSNLTPPIKVLLIRHGEKLPSKPDGIYLDIVGVMHSWALVDYFKQKAPQIDAIYATPQGIEGENSYRPMETCTPLAQSRDLAINANEGSTLLGLTDSDKLVANIKSTVKPGSTVVICWEHDHIPALAQAFGAANVPAKWDGTVFDDVWEFEIDGNSVDFSTSKQKLPKKFTIPQSAYAVDPIAGLKSTYPLQYTQLQTFCPAGVCTVDWHAQVQCCNNILYGDEENLPVDNSDCKQTKEQCQTWYGVSQ